MRICGGGPRPGPSQRNVGQAVEGQLERLAPALDPGGEPREFGVIGTDGRISFDLTDNETLHVQTNRGTTDEIATESASNRPVSSPYWRTMAPAR